jgi:outer membrane protein OmpA-like peptidoglycan-associated protein
MVGNQEANKQLSLRRAQSVVNYLIQHGIDSKRLTAVGYGKEKPVVVDDALSRQYNFLLKGQVLDEKFILSLPQDQQEICNSLNRRTEFRVLKTTYNLY